MKTKISSLAEAGGKKQANLKSAAEKQDERACAAADETRAKKAGGRISRADMLKRIFKDLLSAENMQKNMPRIKAYSLLTLVLLAALTLLNISSVQTDMQNAGPGAITGYAAAVSGFLASAETESLIIAGGEFSLLKFSLMLACLAAFLVLCIAASAKNITEMRIAYTKTGEKEVKKEAEDKIRQDEEKLQKEQLQKQHKIKGRAIKAKIKVMEIEPAAAIVGIKPRSFSCKETVFTHNLKREQEAKDEAALAEKSAAEAAAKGYKEKVTDKGRFVYSLKSAGRMKSADEKYPAAEDADKDADRHSDKDMDEDIQQCAEQYAHYAAQQQEQLAGGESKKEDRVVRIFRLAAKDDFYPILECIKEGRHVVIITAGTLLQKNPEELKKFAKQLEYMGMAYNSRLAALDRENFTVIPGFARFETLKE
jgi:hypothetical protein